MAKQKKTSKAAPKRKSVRAKARPPTAKKSKRSSKPSTKQAFSADWKSVFVMSEAIHTGAIDKIHRGIETVGGGSVPFDFDHLLPELRSIVLAQNPECDAFVFAGSPESIGFPSNENSLIEAGFYPVPVLNIILMPRGHQPPPLVAIRDFQHGSVMIRPMDSMNLTWTDSHTWATEELAGRVWTLSCTSRMTQTAFKAQSERDLFSYEYASLFFMRPSVDWKTEINNDSKLSIRQSMFQYKVGDEIIDEEYDRDMYDGLKDFVADFAERYDLDEDEHLEPLKAVIKDAFEKAREVKQAKVDLFNEYDSDVLEGVKVVKIYPRNDFVKEEYKSPYVNEYYGKADVVV